MPWNLEQRDRIGKAVRERGAAIIRGKGRTRYGISMCASVLAQGIISGKRVTASVSAPMRGEYGIEGISMSFPSLIGKRGIERCLVTELDNNERELFRQSASGLKRVIQQLI